MNKHVRITEYLFIIIVFLLFIVIANKYIIHNIKDDVAEYTSKESKELWNAVDNRFGKCTDGEIRIDVEGGYVCRQTDIPASIYRNIYDTYPQSAGGKEIIYEFLDYGEIGVADKMLDNIYDLSRYEPVRIENIAWDEDPYDEKYWRFLFYSLRPTRHLLYAWRETGDEKYKEKLIEILNSYVDIGSDKEETWDDYHAVAFRTMVLTNIWWKLREEKALDYELSEKMLKTLEKHGRFLIDTKHYEPGHNHGINEAVSLFLLSINFPELNGADTWYAASTERLGDGINDLIDKDGVLIENSPYYHFYVLQKFSQINSFSKKYNIVISENFDEVVDKMIDYSKYILRPNREVPLIGASMYDVKNLTGELGAIAENDKELEYVLTQGKSGEKPKYLNKLFKETGQVIMRSSWGTKDNFEEQTHLVFNIGSYRTLHSDYDALNFVLYSKGRDLIIDSGLYSYEDSELSRYFDSTLAHNTVVVDDKTQMPGAVLQGNFVEGDGFVQQSASHDLYPGVTHYRTISMINDNVVLIIDKLVSDSKHNYKQLFHLAPDLTHEINNNIVDVVDDEGKDMMQIYQFGDGAVNINYSRGSENPINGWCSLKYEEKLPNTALIFEQDSETAEYKTVIHIGNKKDNVEISYDNEKNIIFVSNDVDNFEIKASLPETMTDFVIEKKEKRTDENENYYKLKYEPKLNQWSIVNQENKESISNYKVVNIGGKVGIMGGKNSNFIVNIRGVDNYYSVSDVAKSDILVDEEKFRVYEQEDFVPIFGYHHVINNTEMITHPDSEIKVSDFAKQIAYLNDVYGCRWYTFEDIMKNYVLKNKKTPKMACVLNFDDGRRNNYMNAYPVLDKYDAIASFYVIPGQLEKSKYMTWGQVNELYKNGYEIGSHTIGGGSLLEFEGDHEELTRQIFASKEILRQHGYGEVSTIAYPLGEWNEVIEKLVKDAGYIAARDTSKDNNWRDKRALTASMDEDFIWHMYYYKPENDSPEKLVENMGYNTWWQYEEGDIVANDVDDDIQIRSSIRPTLSSYAIVSLPDIGDSIENKFIVRKDSEYTIEILASAGTNFENRMEIVNDNFDIDIDGVQYDAQFISLDKDSCFDVDGWVYCTYYVEVNLNEGAHVMTTRAKSNSLKLDKFRLFREFQTVKEYDVVVTELIDNGYLPTEEKSNQINLSITKYPKINDYFYYFVVVGAGISAFFSVLFIIIDRRKNK